MTSQQEIQLGKKRITLEFIKDIEKRLEKHRNVTIKISVLKSARESKEDVKKYQKRLLRSWGASIHLGLLGLQYF